MKMTTSADFAAATASVVASGAGWFDLSFRTASGQPAV